MQIFMWFMILLMLGSGVITSITNNATYIGLQFIFMLVLVVGIPIIHILYM